MRSYDILDMEKQCQCICKRWQVQKSGFRIELQFIGSYFTPLIACFAHNVRNEPWWRCHRDVAKKLEILTSRRRFKYEVQTSVALSTPWIRKASGVAARAVSLSIIPFPRQIEQFSNQPGRVSNRNGHLLSKPNTFEGHLNIFQIKRGVYQNKLEILQEWWNIFRTEKISPCLKFFNSAASICERIV